MWNEPSKERLEKVPRLYETEHIPLRDKLIHLHFVIGGCDWWITEFDGDDIFFGFAVLNNDFQNAEWGYVSFSELKSIKIDGWLEVDCELEEYWKVRRASEIDKIRIANGWLKEKETPQDLSKEDELILKVKAGHFRDFQSLSDEVASFYYGFLIPRPLAAGSAVVI